jgi:pilus assembly protein CpaE
MRIMDWHVLSSNHPQHGEDGGSQVLIVCPDARMSAELAATLAAELPDARLAVEKAYPSRSDAAKLAASVSLCFLDAVSDTPSALGILSWLAAVAPSVPVVALLRANDPDLILRCLRGGAAEFLIPPFTQDQLRAVLRKLTRPITDPGPAGAGGEVFCIMPGKGACGATTIACNLAFALHRLGRGRILLADLDGLTGTIAFVLKLKSNYSFVDAVSHAGALDRDVWRALVTQSRGIDVLLSPENPVDCYSEPLDPAPLVTSSRRAYDYVVLDTGGAHGDWNEALARLSDVLLLVTTNELPALHATQRALAHLEGAGVARSKARAIVNRYQPRAGLPGDAIAKALKVAVFATLPNDYEAIHKALMDGQPSPPATAFGRSIATLARTLTGPDTGVTKPSVLEWLRSLLM